MTLRPPTPRQQVYDLYWYFASERHRIFARRVNGQPAPWSSDPILSTFKFCNVFRAADRVSQFLIRSVAYHEEECSPADRIFQIIAFRTFSNIATWRSLCGELGRQPMIDDLTSGRFLVALNTTREKNGKLYTGAFILCASDVFGRGLKHLNHVELFHEMFVRREIAGRLIDAPSLSAIYSILHDLPLMGDFMSYQTAIDLNYSSLVDFSENDFTKPGPGAIRGIRKVFTDLGDLTPAETIHWMVDRQEDEFARLGLHSANLWGRPLHAIDCQGLFCETDKYCREALPGLKSSRSRIKARFAPTPESMHLYFPPKWGLNNRLPSRPVLGEAGFGTQENQRALAARPTSRRRELDCGELSLALKGGD